MRPTALTLLRHSRAALWAALVSIALLQVAAAEHAHEHDADELGEDCGLCIQLDSTKTAVASSGADSAIPRPITRIDGAPHLADAALETHLIHIRAPPLL